MGTVLCSCCENELTFLSGTSSILEHHPFQSSHSPTVYHSLTKNGNLRMRKEERSVALYVKCRQYRALKLKCLQQSSVLNQKTYFGSKVSFSKSYFINSTAA